MLYLRNFAINLDWLGPATWNSFISNSNQVPPSQGGSTGSAPSPALSRTPAELAWRPTPPRLWAHPSFAPEWGRVTRGFDPLPIQREWQAGKSLKQFQKWPPPEGELFVIQIDQDSPPPPPPRPGANTPPAKFREWAQQRQAAVLELQGFVTRYTGQTVVFRAQRVDGKLRLVELNPNG